MVTVHPERRRGRIQRPYQGQVHRAPGGTCCTPCRTPAAPPCASGCCSSCRPCRARSATGTRLRPESLAVTFAGHHIADLAGCRWPGWPRPAARRRRHGRPGRARVRGAPARPADDVAATITADLVSRIEVLLELGLGYLSMSRSTPTLSGGELQRLRLATALRSGLFGVVYVLDEPSAGLHPADAEPLLAVLDRLKAAGNSLFVVEHDMDVVRRADWVVDVGPGAGERRRAGPAQRPGRGAWRRCRPRPTRRFLFPSRARRPARAGRAAAADRPHRAVGRDPAQRAPPRRRVPARRPHGGDRRLGVGQVDPGEPGAGRRRRGAPRHAPPARGVRRRGGRAGRRRPGRRARRSRQGHRAGGGRPARAGRPEADRAHAPVQPGDLHRPLRRGAQAVRRDATRPGPRGWGAGRFSFNVAGGGARPARARGSWRWSCSSCPASTRRARPARARATTRRPSRSPTAAAPSPTCWT